MTVTVDGKEVKILGSTWFTPMQGVCIGIVIKEGDEGREAFIGICGDNNSEEYDAAKITAVGAKFPLKQAEEIIGVKPK